MPMRGRAAITPTRPFRLVIAALVATGLLLSMPGGRTEAGEARTGPTIGYLEIVSDDMDCRRRLLVI